MKKLLEQLVAAGYIHEKRGIRKLLTTPLLGLLLYIVPEPKTRAATSYVNLSLTCDLQDVPDPGGYQDILSVTVDRIGGGKDIRNFPIRAWTNQVSTVTVKLLPESDYVLTVSHSLYQGTNLMTSSPNPSLRYSCGKINTNDVAPPTNTFRIPEFTEAATVTFTGFASDESNVGLKIFGDCTNQYSTLNGTGGEYTATLTLTKQGLNEIFVVAKDALGNATTNIQYVTCNDYQGPNVTLNYVDTNSLGSHLVLSGRMTDLNQSRRMEVTGDISTETHNVDEYGNWNTVIIASKTGNVNYNLTFYDKFGNATVVNKEFYVDTGNDTDGDGLTDLAESKIGSNPLAADTDNDGMSDGLEVRLGYNPLDRESVFRIRSIELTQSGTVNVTANSAQFNNYVLFGTTNQGATWERIASLIATSSNSITLCDTNNPSSTQTKWYKMDIEQR